MKTKNLTFLLALTFLFSSSSFVHSDDLQDAVIKEIKSLYSKWQPILDKERENGFKDSHSLEHDYELESQRYKLIEGDIGTLIIDQNVKSHHGVYSEHYYNNKRALCFIYWRFSSIGGGQDPEIPGEVIHCSTERRLYFDHAGKVIKDLESFISADTKAKLDNCRGSGSEISYSYHLDLDLYNRLKSIPKGKYRKVTKDERSKGDLNEN